MSLSSEKTILVTTFRKSGVGVGTPTWVVPIDDGRIGFWTSSQSGKAKRLRNNPRITIQPSNNRGRVKPNTEPVEGVAELTTAGKEFDEVQRKVKTKYGALVPITRFLNTLGHLGKKHPYGDLVVVVSLKS